jgi:putative DNA primase/helicase
MAPVLDEGERLLDQLDTIVTRHVALPRGVVEAIALWTVFTYAIDAFDIAPILAVLSPVKGCGKTTLVLILRALVRTPQIASNISPSALFRVIDKQHPTLLIDEIDTQLPRNEELRGILNAGHTRGTAKVIRSVKTSEGDFDVREFDVWAAKLLAGIGKLPPTIQDRAIIVPMRRRLPHERIERIRQDRIEPDLAQVRAAIAKWTEAQLERFRRADPSVPEELSDRACDNWRPLFAIADAAGGDWPDRARRAALLLNESDAMEEDKGTLLLADISKLFDESEVLFLQTGEILSALNKLEERPWARYHYGNELTSQGLAQLLQPFGVRPTQRRVVGDRVVRRGYRRHDFGETFKRYLQPPKIRDIRDRL